LSSIKQFFSYCIQFFSILGNVNDSDWLINAKSEGDDPDYISHEISVKVAEKLVKNRSFNLDIPSSSVSQTKEKVRLRKNLRELT